jgi:hypothetical protein
VGIKMKEMLYEDQLKEFFGPNPTKIYVKHYNDFSTKINQSLHKCEAKFGRETTKEENHYCYYAALAKHIPSLITALKNAAKSECKGNSGCVNKLLGMAKSYEQQLPQAKKMRDDFKKKM